VNDDGRIASMRHTGQRERIPVTDRLGFALACFTAAFAPLMFGAAEKHWTLVLVLLLGAALPLLSTQRLSGVQAARLLLPIMSCGLLLAAVVVLQSLDFALSDHDRALWTQAEELLGHPLEHRGVLAPGYPWASLGRPLAFLLALLAGLLIGGRRSRGDLLVRVLIWASFAYACLGLAQYAFQPERLLWAERHAYLGSLTGPFVNRNTAATYFGMGFLVLFTRMLVSIEPRLPPLSVDLAFLRATARLVLDQRELRRLIGATTLLSATLLTGSRAGSLLTVLATVVVVFAVLRRRVIEGAQGRAWAGILTAGALLLGLGVVSAAMATRGLGDAARLEIYQAAIRAVKDHVWLGTGLGSFELVIPGYRSEASPTIGVWDYAHSTPLEIMTELGVPAFLALAALWAWFGWVLLAGIRASSAPRPLVISAAAAAFLAASHSCIDFSLQIPGFSVPFAMLLGAGLSRALMPQRLRTGAPAPG